MADKNGTDLDEALKRFLDYLKESSAAFDKKSFGPARPPSWSMGASSTGKSAAAAATFAVASRGKFERFESYFRDPPREKFKLSELEEIFGLSDGFEPPEPKAPPVTVHAPIVLDAETGAQPLLDFVEFLKRNDNIAVADAEGQRLAPYMAGLSLYLTDALSALDPDSAEAKEKDRLKSLTTPGALSSLFTSMARVTRSTILSEVALAPTNIRLAGPASSLLGHEFNTNYSYRGRSCNFGFLQVYQNGHQWNAQYSSTLPIFLLDCGMMAAVMPHAPEAMLKDFQRVMTLVNHDMLHHFTSPVIKPTTANNFSRKYDPSFQNWVKTQDDDGTGVFYEAWAQVTHEKVLLTPGGKRETSEIGAGVERFFDELERIRDDMARDGTPASAAKARETVDYYGMMMAHALTRLFPLDHWMMSYCVDCMSVLDTMPEKTLNDFFETFDIDPSVADSSGSVLRNVICPRINNTGKMKDIIDSYRQGGFNLLPDHDGEISYKNLKLLQLSKFSAGEVFAHMPEPTDPAMAKTRDKVGETTLSMVLAAAKTAEFMPPSGMK